MPIRISQLQQVNSIDDSTIIPVVESVEGSLTTLKTTAETFKNYISSESNVAIIAANLAMKRYVDTQISTLIGGAPGVLNTLGEIADALNSQTTVGTALTNLITKTQNDLTLANVAMQNYINGKIAIVNASFAGYVDGIANSGTITSSDVISALGFTPYNASNPAGYITSTSISGKANISALSNVAFTGSYNDLSNKPTITSVPTVVSAFINDAGYITSANVASVSNSLTLKANISALSTVAFTGSYNDLSNKPSSIAIPSSVSAFINDVGYITSTNISNKANIASTLAGYGITDAYTKTATDALLATKASTVTSTSIINALGFTPYNASNPAGYVTTSSSSANITLANVISALGFTPYSASNPAGYITSAAIANKANISSLANVATTGSYNDLIDKPTDLSSIPTVISAFTNDVGYVTSANISGKANAATTLAGYGITDAYTKTATDALLATKASTITTANVISALGFTPYNATNPSGYITSASISNKANISSLANVAFTGSYNDLINKPTITSVPTVISAFTNDAGYVTSANISGKANAATTLAGYGITDAYTKTATDALLASKASTVTSANVISALGFVPYNATNPNGYITAASILTRTSQLINDTGYITSADLSGKANVATSLAGYGITDAYTKTATDALLATKASTVTSANVISALGFTPYNATNPNGYVTSANIAGKANVATSLAGYGITDAYTKTAIDALLVGKTGTVTRVQGSGSVGGLTLSGDITSSGNLTLSGTLAAVASVTGGTGVVVSPGTGTGVIVNIGQAVATTSSVQFNSLSVGSTTPSGTAGEIRATNNITAYYSDDRLKTRLGNIENAMDKLLSLDGFYYEANEIAQAFGYDVKKEVGVSAQQVQAIMPEVVAPAPIDEQYLTVRYERLVPLLIEAIKELSAKVSALEAK